MPLCRVDWCALLEQMVAPGRVLLACNWVNQCVTVGAKAPNRIAQAASQAVQCEARRRAVSMALSVKGGHSAQFSLDQGHP